MKFYNYMEKLTSGNVHTLIAGCTGSGKSVLLNGIICNILTIPRAGMILIDPKKVELTDYRRSFHTLAYADDPTTTGKALSAVVYEMERRFKAMAAKGLKKTTEAPIYVIIDELAQFSRKINPAYSEYNSLLSQIITLGRAAGIFVIACTQRPTNDVITPIIKCNCDCKIALRTSSEQESRNIIGISEARNLPRWGNAIMLHPDFLDPVMIPVNKYDDDEIRNFIV